MMPEKFMENSKHVLLKCYAFYGGLSEALTCIVKNERIPKYMHAFKNLMNTTDFSARKFGYWELYMSLVDFGFLKVYIPVGDIQRLWLTFYFCSHNLRLSSDVTKPVFLDASVSFKEYMCIMSWVFKCMHSRSKCESVSIPIYANQLILRKVQGDYFFQIFRNYIFDFHSIPSRKSILPKRIVPFLSRAEFSIT